MCAFSKVEKSSVNEHTERAFSRQPDDLQRTVNTLRTRLARSAEEHDKAYVKIMKVNSTTDNTAWTFPLTSHQESRSYFSY